MLLNILHISDFHYRSGKNLDYVSMVKDLIASVKSNAEVDLVIFSGDLVFSGEHESDFTEAYALLISPLLEALGLGEERLMIAPGNHDMERGCELEAITQYYSSVQDAGQLRKVVKDNRQVLLSMDNFRNYNSAIWKLHDRSSVSDYFVKSKSVTIKGEKISLIDINSAWRCTRSEDDRGNLLFPVDYLKDAIDNAILSGATFIMCNMHHSLSDFKEFIEDELQELIYDRCHFLFTGHYHKQRASVIEASSIGLLHNRASAVYNRHDKYSQYGYCLISFDTNDFRANIKKYTFSDNVFKAGPETICHIPMDKEKFQINEFRKKIHDVERRLMDKANDLFVSGRQVYDENNGFKQLFVPPVLKDKSVKDEIASRKKGNHVSYTTIIDSKEDYIIYGLDKCGKTSLLWKILLETLHEFYIKKCIAYYIDAKEWSCVNCKSLLKQLGEYLQLNKRATQDIFNEYSLLLIVDNFKVGDSEFKKWLNDEIKTIGEADKVRIIAAADETLLSGYNVTIRNGGAENVPAKNIFIHEISRKQLHQLAIRWPNLSDEKRKVVERKILQVFNQMHIPFNYWTASLFLWIFEKTDEANIHNNFELVRLYVDELLGRRKIVADRELNLQYNDLLSYLGNLAHYLLSKHEDMYAVSYKDLVDFTEDYRHTHLKFTETTKNTINRLLQTGTLYERTSDRYTFRLKGVWEFFLAYRMVEDPDFLKEVVDSLNLFLSFSNELELYAGFKPEDMGFVEKIFTQTKLITQDAFDSTLFKNIDERLIEKLSSLNNLVEDLKMISASTDFLENDESNEEMILFSPPIDTSDMQLKRYYEVIEPNIINVQKALFILARVYRNSRVCDNPIYGDEILNYVLYGMCNLGFMVFDEVKKSFQDKSSLLDNFGTMIPLVIQAFAYDAMIQHNLSRVIEEKLEELIKFPKSNQYLIFLTASCLLDLDTNKYSYLISRLKSVLNRGGLRFAMYLKCCLLFTNQERLSKETSNCLCEYINDFQIDNKGREQAQYLLENLKKKREQKLLSWKELK